MAKIFIKKAFVLGTPEAEATLVNAESELAFTDLEVDAGLLDALAAPVFTTLEADVNASDARGDLAFIELEADVTLPNARATPAFTALEADADLPGIRADTAFTVLEPDVTFPNAQADLALTSLEPDATFPNAQSRFTDYTVDVTDMEATADCWISDVVGCIDDANHNVDPLEVDGTAATKKNTYMRFPVNNFPTGTTVNSATLRTTLHAATGALDPDRTIEMRGIAVGNEGWAETAPTCSAQQGPEAASWGTAVIGAGQPAGTAIVFTLNATARTRLANRMGASSFTIRLVAAVGTINTQFHDRADGTAANRPRLTFQFTKTV